METLDDMFLKYDFIRESSVASWRVNGICVYVYTDPQCTVGVTIQYYKYSVAYVLLLASSEKGKVESLEDFYSLYREATANLRYKAHQLFLDTGAVLKDFDELPDFY